MDKMMPIYGVDNMKSTLVLFLFLMPRLTAFADDGPLVQNDGAFGPMVYPLSLKEKSTIRMVKEYLTFNFGSDSTTVTAKFFFQNTDTQRAVTQLAGFPDVALGFEKTEAALGNKKEDEMDNYKYLYHRYFSLGFPPNALDHLETLLDGVRVTSTVEYGYVNKGDWVPDTQGEGALVGWYVLKIVFPPGGKRILERRYACSNAGSMGRSSFNYIVHTGGGWSGTIGELRADLILDKDTDGDDKNFEHDSTEWQKTGNRSYRLVWTDFDPREYSSRRQIQIDDCPKEMDGP